MTEKILVTYATKYGSTQGVAEAIAEELRNKGQVVDLIPARDVKALDVYSAVVLGTPLYIGNILGDASKFLSRHRSELQRLPSALFVLGPLEITPKDLSDVQVQLDSVLNRLSWFKPVVVEIFAGAMDPDKFRFPDSLLKLMPAARDSAMFQKRDGRDWEAIRTWADSLPLALMQTV